MVTPEVTNVASVFQRSDIDLTQAGQRCISEHAPQMLVSGSSLQTERYM